VAKVHESQHPRRQLCAAIPTLELARRVTAYLVGDTGSLHLDGDEPAVDKGCLVDLGEGRRRNRLVIELGEQPGGGCAEVFDDDLLNLGVGDAGDVLLQPPEVSGDVW
jgi:hypothetical protein